ncbi:MAG: hypothetical protein HY897_10200 [Deltaproteobacteria bacterium]|nr:hypothetical protein [Deltaproteobacteria bacterium]
MFPLAVPVLAASGGFETMEVAPRESGVQFIRYADGQAILYNYRWELAREGRRVTVNGKGDNNKAGAERVEWVETSEMEMAGGGLRTRVWIKESSGAEKESWRIEYDWTARKAAYTYRDRASGKTEARTVTFGPRAFAADAMHFVLRGFPFEKGTGTAIKGEFVLTDGSVTKGAVIHRGEERIGTAFGPLDTFKLEFRPSGIVGVLAPKMFIWYTKTTPHLFVRYDGKDDGFLKPRTTNELVKYSPEARIRPEKGPPRGEAGSESGGQAF